MKVLHAAIISFLFLVSHISYKDSPAYLKDHWVDSVYAKLSLDQKIAQLMVIRAHSNLGYAHVQSVTDNIKKYNVGGLCFFQGGPVRQANLTNFYQKIAPTPLLISMDAEWGLAMRLDSVKAFPYQLTMGALDSSDWVYQMGLAVGEQCKRLGVHINYAPVVDINNNPRNPVIGYRSFGEDKNQVIKMGLAYMRGMQDAGIMACAKHFPGHGDVAVDSHLDLPVIKKSLEQLTKLELVPFQTLIDSGVQSVMVGHLSVPAIDNGKNRATSISRKAVQELLVDKMGFKGLIVTDALEMKGVAKYFPGGTIAVESLIAGNDILCLPESVPGTIAAVKMAIANKKLTEELINEKVKKVLAAKYDLGLSSMQPIETANLTEDLNARTGEINKAIAERAITILADATLNEKYMPNTSALPSYITQSKKVAYIGIGLSKQTEFGKALSITRNADTFAIRYTASKAAYAALLQKVSAKKYDAIIVGIHDFNNRPNENYKISTEAISFWKKLNAKNVFTFVFGNVLASSNFCGAKNLVACYQNDAITQQAAADLINGKIGAQGTLPVSVCKFRYGQSLRTVASTFTDANEKKNAILP